MCLQVKLLSSGYAYFKLYFHTDLHSSENYTLSTRKGAPSIYVLRLLGFVSLMCVNRSFTYLLVILIFCSMKCLLMSLPTFPWGYLYPSGIDLYWFFIYSD